VGSQLQGDRELSETGTLEALKSQLERGAKKSLKADFKGHRKHRPIKKEGRGKHSERSEGGKKVKSASK